MSRLAKLGLVIAGYVAAFGAGTLAAWRYDARVSALPYDTSGGMYAAGEFMSGLAAFLTDARVAYPLKLISQLYRVEDLADRRGLDAETRQDLRHQRALPILERLQRWLKGTIQSEPPASALAKACAYCVNQWVALNEFRYDGLLALDNNCCERQIRSLAVGRKNYLFAGSDAGAERAAILYSLLRTAALAKIDTYAYLIKLLERLAGAWPQRRIDKLLPEHHVPAVESVETAVAEPQPVG